MAVDAMAEDAMAEDTMAARYTEIRIRFTEIHTSIYKNLQLC